VTCRAHRFASAASRATDHAAPHRRCSADYVGRLTAHLPLATRLIMIKADGTVLIHADSGTKALNWMPPGSRGQLTRFRNLALITAGS